MKHWERVAYREKCGQCGKLLFENTPVLTVTITGVKKPKYRCEDCAGIAPTDLPPRTLPETIEQRVTAMRELAEIREREREWLPHPDD